MKHAHLVLTPSPLGVFVVVLTIATLLSIPAPTFGSDMELPRIELASRPALRAAAVSGATPRLVPPSSMRVQPGKTADQLIYATDAGGDPLTFLKGLGPDYMAVTTVDPGMGTATGQIHLAPSALTSAELASASIVVSDGVLTDERSFNIVSGDNIPVMVQPSDMEVEPGRVADQALSATDADHDPLTFSLALGPWFVTVGTTGPESGNVHLTPVLADSGSHSVTVSASDGIAVDNGTFQVAVPTKTTPALAQPSDMAVLPGQSVLQQLRAMDIDGQVLSFYKAEGPRYRIETPEGVSAGRFAIMR